MLIKCSQTLFSSDPTIGNIVWKPVSKDPIDPLHYLHIQSPENITLKTDQNLGNREFWDNLPFEENKKLFFQKDEL